MKKTNTSLLNKGGAIVLTLIVIPSLFISLFTFPVEFFIFNSANYYPVLESDEFKSNFPAVVSEIITGQIFTGDGKSLPVVMNEQKSLRSAVVQHIPVNWMNAVFTDIIENITSYFNFKTPYSSFNVDISGLKQALIDNKSEISEDYLQFLNYCSDSQSAIFETDEEINIYDLPPCNPPEENKKQVVEKIANTISDRINQLPDSVSISGLIPAGFILGEYHFYYYSLARWIFRIIPFATIIMLILIASFLKRNKKLMRKWIGLLITGISAAALVCLLVLLVGFDQFLGMILNRYFSKLIAGFGSILLKMLQSVGTQVVLWMIGVSAVAFLFGLILILAARFTKEVKTEYSDGESKIQSSGPENQGKEIVPETMEEIEEKEKLNKSNGSAEG